MPAVDNAHDRVVVARQDRSVVEQERIGDGRQALQRLAVVSGDGLVGEVAARHHERAAADLGARWLAFQAEPAGRVEPLWRRSCT